MSILETSMSFLERFSPSTLMTAGLKTFVPDEHSKP